MNAREYSEAVEHRIFVLSKAAIERVTGYVPVPISGKNFQIEKGDVLTVNPVSAATKNV
jgi:hypothetical protein